MNYKSISLFTLLGLVILFSSCGKDRGDLDLNFKLTYDGEPMVMFQEYTYPSGEKFTLNRVSFYTSNIALDGNVLKEVEYFDLTDSHSTADGAADGLTYNIKDLPAESYSNVKFSLGVTPENNAMTPADFENSNALSRAGEYWNGWQSYVFLKIEGDLDIDGDGASDRGISLHVGGDENFASITFPKPITIAPDEVAKAEFFIDLKDAFENNGNLYDLQSNPALHSKDMHLEFMQQIMTGVASTMTAR